MPQVVSCPQCSSPLRVPDTFAPGTQVKCPKCERRFPVPTTEPKPPAQESITDRPVAAAPELPPTPHLPPSIGFDGDTGPRDPFQERRGVDDLATDYKPDIGELFNEGMKHYSPTLGPMVGYGFILVGVSVLLGCMGALPFVGFAGYGLQVLMGLFVTFAYYGGYVVVCLRQMRGQGWDFTTFFHGFIYWGPLFLNHLLKTLLVTACMLPGVALMMGMFIAAGIFSGITSGPNQPPPPPPDFKLLMIGLFGGLFLMLLACIPLLYFWTRCFMLAPFLIIDRHAGPVQAIQANWNITSNNIWNWLLIGFLLAMIDWISDMICGFIFPFLAPIYYFVLTTLHLQLTSRSQLSEGPL